VRLFHGVRALIRHEIRLLEHGRIDSIEKIDIASPTDVQSRLQREDGCISVDRCNSIIPHPLGAILGQVKGPLIVLRIYMSDISDIYRNVG
jgi:hypothetical protein